MIKRLYMRQFRGIAEGEINDFAQINLIVGPNNTGKTTVLEAIYLAAVADTRCELVSDKGEFFPVTVSADTDLLGLEPMARTWERHGYPSEWQESRARWDEGQIKLFQLPDPLQHYVALGAKATEKGFVESDARRTAMFAVEPREGSVPPFVEKYFGEKSKPWEGRRFVFLWYPPFTYRYNELAGWWVEGDVPLAERTLFYDFNVATGHLPAALIQRGYKTIDWLQNIGKYFSEIFDQQDGIDVTFDPAENDPTRRRGFVKKDGIMIPIDLWGDGARHAFKVLAALRILAEQAEKDKPCLFLWEDPELFMNPSTLWLLLKKVIAIAKDKPIQVFITTQSMEVIAHFTQMLKDKILPEESVKAFRLGLRDGQLIVSKFHRRNLIAWLGSGIDPRAWEKIDTPLQYRMGDEE
jgi:hypothetical protein